MKDNRTVTIVIPNWNGRKLLEDHLPAVIIAADHSEIIVVDDGSTDDSVAFLKKNYSHLVIIEKKQNEGFSSTVNLGVKKAKGDIVILLNTDIEPEKGFLAALLAHFSDEKVFAVGCMDKSVENGKIVERGRGEAIWKKGMLVHRRGDIHKIDTAWVSGGSGAFRKKYWEQLEGMDELFNPYYWEDIDLSYRARKSGYTIVFEPKSIVIHKHEEGAIKTTQQESAITRVAFRNQLFFTWKNITNSNFLFEHFSFLFPYLLTQLLKGNFPIIGGFFDAGVRLPVILKKRFIVKKMFIFDDKDLLPNNFS